MNSKYLTFRLIDGFSLAETRQELEKKGLKDIFIIEDDSTGETLIGGFSNKTIRTKKATLIEEKPASVNWEEQWSLFAENFTDGKAHIILGDKTLLLTPGAGFGDLSHPTTSLMIEMLKNYARNESIVDIGTGSGILALAALLLGAKKAIGIDIDIPSLKHAKINAKINHLKATFSKNLPKKIPRQNILLMNMIFPEQLELAPDRLNYLAKFWIVSGIMKSEKRKYLSQAKKWGWKPIAEHQKTDWLGWVFEIERG